MSLHRYTKAVTDELQTDGPSCPHSALLYTRITLNSSADLSSSSPSSSVIPLFHVVSPARQLHFLPIPLPPSSPPPPPPTSVLPTHHPHLFISAQFKTFPPTRLDLHVRTRPTRLDSCSSTLRLGLPPHPHPTRSSSPPRTYRYIYPPRIYPPRPF